MSNWTRTLAVCCALALSAPAAMVVAQDAKDGKEAGKEEAKTYASAKEVMDSFKELTKDFGRNPTEEQIQGFFGVAWARVADYIEGHPDATDHKTLYSWAGPRGQYGPAHEGYIRLAGLYLKANPEAKDAAEWKKWRDSYVLVNGPVPLGMGLQLEAKPTSRRTVLDTPEAMDAIESVAGKTAIVVQRSATCDSIKKAVRDAAGEGIVSTADRNKAKAKAETDAFARLVEGGAIRESGKTYVVREVRANETEE